MDKGVGGLKNWTIHGRHMCIIPYNCKVFLGSHLDQRFSLRVPLRNRVPLFRFSEDPTVVPVFRFF